MRRVAITGIGIISCLGCNAAAVRDALREGRSGIEFLPERKELGFRSGLSGTINDFPGLDVSKALDRSLSAGGRFALSAAMQAVSDSGLSDKDIASDRTGVIVGNTGNMADLFELVHQKHLTKKNLTAMATVRTMASSVSAHLSTMFHTRGHSMTVATACSSGATAVGHAAHLIESGLQDRVIAGGVQEITWQSACLSDALRVYSKREDSPREASRPFDKHRDGVVPSGGSGFLILEAYEGAASRGAKIYGEIIGHSTNSDGQDMTAPSGTGTSLCMRMALSHAGIAADQIDYINAHATSTVVGDTVEARAIADVFGDRPYVSSTKSMTGHEVGAAGANELIYTLLMMNNGFVAPNINVEEVDTDCQCIRLLTNEAIDAELNIAMSNSFGFGGANTVLIVKKT